MQIIIFEGIASSGKTTLEKLLFEKLPKAKIVNENITLMKLIDNQDKDVALGHLKNLLLELRDEKVENLIIDRFHLTHAFRTRSTLKVFSEIEDELLSIGGVHLILLTIDEAKVRERIEETMERRKDKWKKGAKGSIEERVAYYTDQQKKLLDLVGETSLPALTIDTTDKEWERYINQIETAIK